MSTHSYEIEKSQQESDQLDLQYQADPDEQDDDDLMFDVQAAHVGGFYTPYHPM